MWQALWWSLRTAAASYNGSGSLMWAANGFWVKLCVSNCKSRLFLWSGEAKSSQLKQPLLSDSSLIANFWFSTREMCIHQRYECTASVHYTLCHLFGKTTPLLCSEFSDFFSMWCVVHWDEHARASTSEPKCTSNEGGVCKNIPPKQGSFLAS